MYQRRGGAGNNGPSATGRSGWDGVGEKCVCMTACACLCQAACAPLHGGSGGGLGAGSTAGNHAASELLAGDLDGLSGLGHGQQGCTHKWSGAGCHVRGAFSERGLKACAMHCTSAVAGFNQAAGCDAANTAVMRRRKRTRPGCAGRRVSARQLCARRQGCCFPGAALETVHRDREAPSSLYQLQAGGCGADWSSSWL